MKMSSKQDDMEILKMTMYIQALTEKLVELIDKRLPIKKDKNWNNFHEGMQTNNKSLQNFISEMDDNLSRTYGAKHVGKASQMAQAEYDKSVVEEQFYREVVQISGKGVEISFVLDNDKVKIISISEPIQEKHLERIKNHLKLKLKVDSIELQSLKPLTVEQVNKIKHSIITDLSGSQWILNGASSIAGENKVSISKSEVISSEDLTRNFKLKGEFIGNWLNMEEQ